MNGQAKAAAEQIVEICRTCGPLSQDDGLLRAAELVAAAYLAEHPADENEPITEDWLRSVGFEPFVGKPDKFSWQCLKLWNCVDHWRLEIGGWWTYMQDTTRGQLRRLCSALSITLKEA